MSPVSLPVPGPNTVVRITQKQANEVDTKKVMRQVKLHRAAHREQTAQAVFKSRQNIVGHMLHQMQSGHSAYRC